MEIGERKYAIRKTQKGFHLCEIEIKKTNYGGIRKYSHDLPNLVYKREKYAEKKAHSFYKSVYFGWLKSPLSGYYGVITENEFIGEEVK